MNGSPDADAATTIEHEVWIAAERDDVFAALTTVEGLDGWWGTALEASTDVGGHVVFDHGLGSRMRMEIVAFDPPSRVTWRFASSHDGTDNPASSGPARRSTGGSSIAPTTRCSAPRCR